MAVQISGAFWPSQRAGRMGPFEDGSGNLWVIAHDSTLHLTAYKSSDSGASWGTSFAQSGTDAGYAYDCVFDSANGIIYVATASGGTTGKIIKFTIGTTTWAEVYTSGTRPTMGTDAGAVNVIFLTRRTGGEFVVFYQGPTHSLMGTPYRACYYALCSSAGVWSAGVEVSGAVKSHHYDCKCACLGASDRTHMLYIDSTATTMTHRSVSSANVLDTAGNLGTTQQALEPIYYDATLAKVCVPNASKVYRATSGAGPTWTGDTNTYTAVGKDDYGTTGSTEALVYEPTGSKLYIFWRDVDSDDVYFNSASGTSWGTGASQDTTTAPTGISVGLITGGIGVVFNDGGVYFDTLSVSVGPAKSLIANPRSDARKGSLPQRIRM